MRPDFCEVCGEHRTEQNRTEHRTEQNRTKLLLGSLGDRTKSKGGEVCVCVCVVTLLTKIILYQQTTVVDQSTETTTSVIISPNEVECAHPISIGKRTR